MRPAPSAAVVVGPPLLSARDGRGVFVGAALLAAFDVCGILDDRPLLEVCQGSRIEE